MADEGQLARARALTWCGSSRTFRRAWSSSSASSGHRTGRIPTRFPDAAKPIVAHLAALGALRPIALHSEATEVGLLFVGDPIESYGTELRERLPCVQLGTASADGITVVVRTNATLRSLAEQAEDLQRRGAPHVLCDLAFHHTLVMGPHVVPGDTACLACLAGRVGSRWGDPTPPPEPAATRHAELAANLTAHWLVNRSDPAGTLVNATVTLDLRSLETVRAMLWRVPGCPVCGPWELTGRADLSLARRLAVTPSSAVIQGAELTSQLVRLPDQFRPARSAPTAATPTCCCSCCCCCCCAATLISASVVLPTQVEILARRGMVGDPGAGVSITTPARRPPQPKGSRRTPPLLTVVGWIVVSMYIDPTLGALTVPAVLVGLSYIAFSRVSTSRRPRRGERGGHHRRLRCRVRPRFFLILGTDGIGYLILAVMVPILVIRFFNGRRDELPPIGAMPPPPFPWPQES